MFRLVLFLCGALFAVMQIVGGRADAPSRYGLVPGRMAPLVFGDPSRPAKDTRRAMQEAGQVTQAVPASAGDAGTAGGDAARGAGAGGAVGEPVVAAAFVEPAEALQAGLTLALPLVRPGASPAAADQQAEAVPQADMPADVATDDPVVQYVIGTSVNVRSGPSAGTDALTRLDRGEAVRVVPSDTPGWAHVLIEGDGVDGFIATRFLGDAPQDALFQSTD